MKTGYLIIILFAFLTFGHSNAQSGRKTELLTINWPEQEGWHIVDQQDDATGTMTTIILLKGKETIPDHTEMVTIYSYHGSLPLPLETEIETFYQNLKKYAPTAQKTIIEKDRNAVYTWMICKIEAPQESMIHYAVQGKTESYRCYWSVKEKKITPESQQKWIALFRSSKITSG
ncbi:hypothetical protein [Flavobacterium sp. HTF]|uniref:hypothetical protein n=1 Tax=Flavobacterium sp. HTF TaxID=2170732 RepID=UPI000D5F4BE0|nr:hypothetical protein [Flavobacterium sp. HTF]PWB20572.1 hypothetical protein DCO46_20705 [Flavobacterium sp. HTF]